MEIMVKVLKCIQYFLSKLRIKTYFVSHDLGGYIFGEEEIVKQ